MEVIISKLLSVLIMVSALLGITVDITEFEPIDDFNGGDPFIVETQTGTYYTYTTGTGIIIHKINNYLDAEVIESKTVFYAGMNGTVKDIWAPEIHKIGQHWYIIACAYFDSNEVPRGTMPEETTAEHDDYFRYTFVLESKSDDIFDEYEFKGYLAPLGMNNIDGTYLTYNDKLYFITSSYLDVAYQCLTISEMENPYTLKTDDEGKSVSEIISKPEFYWEKQGWRVNEGPSVLYYGDKIHIVYSASGFSSGHYCLGMLTLNGKNPIDENSWCKSITKVMGEQPLKNIYNAGHCSFLYKDNGDIYMIYHATSTKKFSESPRLTYIKKVNFIGERPVF